MISKDFFAALEALQTEKKIPKEQFMEFLEAGIASAYKREFGEARNIAVQLNPEKATIKIIAYQLVVEEVEDDDKQISLEDAQKIKPSYKVGDIVSEELSTKDFSRIAAQTAKQVILQKLNDTTKSIILEEMSQKEGEIVSCQIRRIENDNIYVEISGSQMEGIMLKIDQVPDEKYEVGKILKVYVKSIRTNARNGANQVLVSRRSNGFVRRLFEQEVPEIKAGLVVIKNIVREAGYRTKIAIQATDPTIDAVGSCIGQKGMRINAVVEELNGENIDVVQYSDEPTEYIARSLSPAKVIAVSLDNDLKRAIVVVPDEMFLKAIGKRGCNAKLAAKLTNWKVDVKKLSEATELMDM